MLLASAAQENKNPGYRYHKENAAFISVLGDDALKTNPCNLELSTLEMAYPEVKRKVEVAIVRFREEIESLEVKDKLYSKKTWELQVKIHELEDKEKKFREEILRKDQGNRFYSW